MSHYLPTAMLAFLALGVGTTAQDPPKGQKDPQSQIEPRSAPGEGQKFLQQFVGRWDVVKTFHPRTGEPAVARGECVQTMIHDGRFLHSEFTFTDAGAKTTGTGTIGFDADTGRFTSFWIDSRSTRVSVRQSRDKFDGRQIVLFAKPLDEANARQSRTVTRLENNGKRVVHQQFGATPDGKERLVMELVMDRRD